MTVVHRISPIGVPTPSGKYSHLSVTHSGARIAVFSGQIGVSKTGKPAAGSGAQTRLIFDAILGLLGSQGATPADLIKLVTFAVGRSALVEFNAVRDEVYSEWFPTDEFPSSTIVVVSGLAAESILVEVEGSFVCR
ncbi:hypothetical protein B7R22_14180 [Subtercola boreus]|uniref:Enamine deaminase RidA n=1 Tax=Subtercola boreus TaxID=120213 RepID=A0A3E0VT02_9MICO|nr:RidA family protein [Subtercola boreus]RFA13142.1 hypothetical protein B7R22_14180 [Subtercola boreus]